MTSLLGEVLQDMVIKDAQQERREEIAHARARRAVLAEQNARVEEAARQSSKAGKDSLSSTKPKRDGAGSDDDEEDDGVAFIGEDVALKAIREKRRRALMAKVQKKKEELAKGHSDYREISQDAFLNEVTGSDKVMVLFFHKDFEKCQIMDKHLKILCREHSEIKMLKINAEKAPFFVQKLSVQILPTIVFFREGKTNPMTRLVGFGDLDKAEKCSTRDIEELFVECGVFDEAVLPDDERIVDTGRKGDTAEARRGATISGRSGSNLYGFGRLSDSDDSDSD